MKIQQKKEGNSLIIKFTSLNNGQLDLSNISQLKSWFNNIDLDNVFNIILDFDEVEYMDSFIICFIVDTFNDIRNKNRTMKLINISKNIYEIFEMINLSKFLDIKTK